YGDDYIKDKSAAYFKGTNHERFNEVFDNKGYDDKFYYFGATGDALDVKISSLTTTKIELD
ncbi:MAG: hypothetical protein J6582_05230, partial [Snodgrassella sp.]|uniref:hypothetical protein n=1 Tax=Snodgrassella sp. TaxID=2815304 RepID=UPI002585C2BD